MGIASNVLIFVMIIPHISRKNKMSFSEILAKPKGLWGLTSLLREILRPTDCYCLVKYALN